MGTKRYKNALLSVFIVVLLLTSAALPILGLASLTSASSPDAKTKLEGFDNTAGKWSTGNLDGWKELDWVPYRIKFSDMPEGTSVYTLKVYHNNLLEDKEGVDRLRGFRVGDESGNPVTGSVTVSGPFYKTYGKGDKDIYYTITVSFTTTSPRLTRCLYWQAHLAFGASGWPGSSLHAYTDISGKGSVPINVPPTPVGSISGYKWNDLNRDNAWSLDEPELSGWTIRLYRFEDNAWIHLADINTDSAGAYTLHLVAGKYRLYEVLKDNWTQTFPSSGYHEVVLSEGETKGNINFGNFFSAAMRGVEVSISPDSQEGLPGETVEYTVDVLNTGSIPDTYELEVSDNAGWGLSLDDTLFEDVENGGSRSTTLRVTIPSTAMPSQTDTITVTATSQADPSVSDSDTCIAHAEEARYGVEVLISPSDQGARPGTTLSYTVIVRNTGNVEDNYYLSVYDNAGWGPTLSENQLKSVPPGENKTTTLNVTIPENAVPSTKDNITVTATSKADPSVSDSDTCIAHTEEVMHGVEVSISPSEQGVRPGRMLSYTVIVKNTGNVEDNYSLSVYDNAVPSWGPKLSENRLENIPPGENKKTTLNVTIPENAVPSTKDNITVTATSQGDPSVSDSDTCIAHATALVAPSAPTLKSPADGTLTNDNTPTFVWIPGLNADNHRLLVDNDPGFTSPIENRLLGFTDNTYTPENRLPDENYSWKVVAINALGENQSSVWTFVIDTIPPDAPSLGSPPDGTITDDNTPTFDWSDVPDAENYDFIIDNDSDFSSPVVQVTVSVSTYTMTVELPDGTYYWKVRARDAAGNVSVWSSTWTIIIRTIVRGVEVSISPGSKSGAPGETLSYTVTVKNNGTVSDTYTLTATDTAAWGPTLSKSSLTLSPQASGTATLTVTIPSTASLGAQDTITVTAKSTTDPAVSASASCTAQAEVQMGVEVSISPKSKSGLPKETLTYDVTVKNTGSIDDTYNLSAVGAEGWSVSIEPTSLILAAGATGEATLRVVVPPDAKENDSMTVTVRATSAAYPSVTDSDTCIAIVKGVPVAPGIGLGVLLAILGLLILLLLLLLAYFLRRRRRGAARHRVLRSVAMGLAAPILAMIYFLRGRRGARRRVFRDASPPIKRLVRDRARRRVFRDASPPIKRLACLKGDC